MIDILLKYIFWYESLNDLDDSNHVDKNAVIQKPVE